jgi:hypothetical protein
MKRNLKLLICFCFAMLLLVSSCLTYTVAALDSPMMDEMVFHSWKELKQLRDASEKSDKAFLSRLSALDEDCDLSSYGHVRFDMAGSEDDYREAFASYYEQMADRKVLFLKDTDAHQLKEISVVSYGTAISSYDVDYQVQHGGKTFILYTAPEKDYSNFLNTETGEPVRQIMCDGYTVKIWERENADLNYKSYRAYYFAQGSDTPSFYVTLASSNWQEDIPEESLSLFGEFRVMTTDEALAKASSLQTWIWVMVSVVGVAILVGAVVIVLRKKKSA